MTEDVNKKLTKLSKFITLTTKRVVDTDSKENSEEREEEEEVVDLVSMKPEQVENTLQKFEQIFILMQD